MFSGFTTGALGNAAGVYWAAITVPMIALAAWIIGKRLIGFVVARLRR